MNVKPIKGLMKHADFIVLDLICLQLSYIITSWVINGWGNPYHAFSYRYLAIVLLFGQLLTIAFSNNYNGILRRGPFKELVSIIQYTVYVLIASLIFLFVVHETTTVSRLQMSLTLVVYIVLDFFVRRLNGAFISKVRSARGEKSGRSIVLITKGELVDEAMEKLLQSENGLSQGYFISGIVLMDDDEKSINGKYDVPVIPLSIDAIKRIQNKWVDEVFILQPSTDAVDRELMDSLTDMGITVHFTLALLNDDEWPPVQMRKLGQYKVLTTSMNFMTYNQAITKRLMDIVGGFVGCVITGILFIFVAPAIYIKSPGPIFFKQDRIGLNGKVFKMYKFRSMYLDAEERKAALAEQNKLGTDLFFKMDDDPRIIGSEKKDKNGNPKGIGNFIRNTSIDEFPQFINVLLGTMSLVGVSLILRAT